MKHSARIIPLLATLLLTGCNTPVKNEEVNQKIWDSIFGESYANFLSHNLTVEASDGDFEVKIEINENTVRYSDSDNDEYYYVVNTLEGDLCAIDYIYNRDGRWLKKTDKDSYESLFTELFFPFSMGFGNYNYEDFQEEDGVYTIDRVECEVYSWGKYVQEDVKITFANEKLSSISFKYFYEDHDGFHEYNVNAKFSKYGSTSFNIPEIKDYPLATIEAEEGASVALTAFGPLTTSENHILNPNKKQVTDATFDHNTLYGSEQLEQLKDPDKPYYPAFLFGITVSEGTKLDLEKCTATTYPALVEGRLNTAKAFRIGFIMETGSFVYAPLQVKEKCAYGFDENNEPLQYKEGEIYGAMENNKLQLPSDQLIYVVCWFDGWDENCVNEAVFQEVNFTLGFSL